jgi:hypothetical protein
MKKLLAWLRAELRRSADHHALMHMSAHELNDLGIGRSESGYLTSLAPDAPRNLNDERAGAPRCARPERSSPVEDRAGLAGRHGVFP